jgi:hypothetical protein
MLQRKEAILMRTPDRRELEVENWKLKVGNWRLNIENQSLRVEDLDQPAPTQPMRFQRLAFPAPMRLFAVTRDLATMLPIACASRIASSTSASGNMRERLASFSQ